MELNLKLLFFISFFCVGTSVICLSHYYFKSAALFLILSLIAVSYPLPTKFTTADGEEITLPAGVKDTFLVEAEPISTNWEKTSTQQVSCGWFGSTEETTVTKNQVMRYKHQPLDGLTLYSSRIANETVVTKTRKPCP